MNTSALQVFGFEGRNVRIVMKGDEPWFVAKDVADALDYAWNGTKTIQHVPEEWRGVESVSTPSGNQDMMVMSEQGVYFFLGRSDKKKSLSFQKWLAGSVVPSVMRTGHYSIQQETPELLISRALIAANEIIHVQTKQIEEMKPKAEFFDTVTNSKTAIDIGSAAKVLNMGIGRTNLFKFLRDSCILTYNNLPRQEQIDAGRFRVIESSYNKLDGSTHVYTKTVVYQKGLDYIRKQLAKAGYKSK